ncbi:hypothetical protein GCM10010528_25330 [Gordonia defluvii]|uniref:ApeA N-terminal domain-containing protein n=1 Tax=Gordonia defluvii TaxID=283718 RepID=A0ABP6LHI6_9ACTN
MKQCESQRILAWFHLPEDPDHRIPGVLTWELADGATLELFGGFSPPPDYQPNPTGSGVYTTQMIGDARPGTIYGETPSGTKLSIWDAQRGKYTASGFHHHVQEEFWSASWVCIGDHIASLDEPRFTKAIVVIDDLYYMIDDSRFCPPQWTRIDGVENPGERLDNGTRLLPYVLPVIGGDRAECVSANTHDACYSLNTRATAPWISPATEAMPDLKLEMMTNRQRRGPVITFSVGASTSIRLPNEAAGSALDFVDRMSPIFDLVRLATFETCGVEEVALTTVDGESISLLSRLGEPAAPTEAHDPTSVVFDFADVPLGKCLAKRASLTNGRQAGYAWNVIVGHCGYAPKFTEQYVSQVLAAAEGFHTWCLDNPSAELNARLKALHNSLAPEVQERLDLDVDNWADWAVWARNHVAHGGTRRRNAITDHSQLHAVARTVHLVTYLAVLRQLDVPVAKIKEALLNHPRLSGFVSHCEIVNQIKPPDKPGTE